MSEASRRFDEVVVARDAPGPQVVDEQPHLDAAGGGRDQRLEEGAGHVVPGRDVELDLDRRPGRGDLGSHRRDGVVVAGDQVDAVAALEGQRAEVVVEGGHRREVRRLGDRRRGQDLRGGTDGRVGLALPRQPAPSQAGTTQDQEDEEARQRHDQDQDQPRHGRRGLLVARQHPEGQELDHVVEEHEAGSQDHHDVAHHRARPRRWCRIICIHLAIEPVGATDARSGTPSARPPVESRARRAPAYHPPRVSRAAPSPHPRRMTTAASTRPSMAWSGPVRTRVEEATRAGR